MLNYSKVIDKNGSENGSEDGDYYQCYCFH